MTSREKVLNVYQGMKTERNLPGGWVALVYTRNPKGDEPLVRVLGRGDTEDAAIDDAASKLPPGSPAGETASACKHERSYSYSEVGEAGYVNKSGTRKCVDCGEEFNPRAVPEPVPTEGAASHKICEATFWMAEERFTCAKFRGHAGLHESLSGTRDIGRTGRYDSSAPEAAAAPLTYDDCTKSEADAAEQWAVAYVCKVGVSKETMIDAISTLRAQVMAYERLSAAPIAPAAVTVQTATYCLSGCGGFLNAGDAYCPSCRYAPNEQRLKSDPNWCWEWFGPMSHRMKCRRHMAHSGEHYDHPDSEANNIGTWRDAKMKYERLPDGYLYPIAPAAEELIQELVAALKLAFAGKPVICADELIARAEEYRKGAKNG